MRSLPGVCVATKIYREWRIQATLLPANASPFPQKRERGLHCACRFFSAAARRALDDEQVACQSQPKGGLLAGYLEQAKGLYDTLWLAHQVQRFLPPMQPVHLAVRQRRVFFQHDAHILPVPFWYALRDIQLDGIDGVII